MTANGRRPAWTVLFGVGCGGDGIGSGDEDVPGDGRGGRSVADPPDSDGPAGAGSTRPGYDDPDDGDDDFGKGEGSDDRIEFRFLTGPLRWGIDHAPGLVIGVSILLFASAELTSGGVGGASDLLTGYQLVEPLASISGASLLAVFAIWSVLLLGIFVYANLIDVRDLVTVLVVNGAVSVLVAGTASSVVLVLTSENPSQLPPNVVYTSGYLLMLLVTGWYVSRSMAYTEGLIGRLDEMLYDPKDGEAAHGRSSSVATPSADELPDTGADGSGSSNGEVRDIQSNYVAFVDELEGKLRKGFGPVQLAHLFAIVVVLPSAYVWWFGSGPQNLGGPTSSLTAFLAYAANLAFDFVIAVVAFKFLVLVRYLHILITESYPPDEDESLRLCYDLRHPDGCAGLHDLGDFAMRVNLLLLIALVYLVYRLYVQGLRALPQGTMADLAIGGVPYNWVFGYVGPVFIFTAVVAAWLYYSFWQLHQRMVSDRRRLLESWPYPPEDGHEHIRPSEPELEEVREAPVWPIDNKQLIPLAVANAVPAVVVIFEGLG